MAYFRVLDETWLDTFILLAEDHYKELYNEKTGCKAPKLQIDKDLFVSNLRAGSMLFLGMFEDPAEFVGYFFLVIANAPHYKHIKLALQDTIYIKPLARKGLVAVKFIKFGIAEAKKRGAFYFMMVSDNARPFDKLLTYCGFRLAGTVFVLDLNKEG